MVAAGWLLWLHTCMCSGEQDEKGAVATPVSDNESCTCLCSVVKARLSGRLLLPNSSINRNFDIGFPREGEIVTEYCPYWGINWEAVKRMSKLNLHQCPDRHLSVHIEPCTSGKIAGMCFSPDNNICP